MVYLFISDLTAIFYTVATINSPTPSPDAFGTQKCRVGLIVLALGSESIKFIVVVDSGRFKEENYALTGGMILRSWEIKNFFDYPPCRVTAHLTSRRSAFTLQRAGLRRIFKRTNLFLFHINYSYYMGHFTLRRTSFIRFFFFFHTLDSFFISKHFPRCSRPLCAEPILPVGFRLSSFVDNRQK